MELDSYFAPDGPLAQASPAYEPRAEQMQMASAVAAALEAGESLIIEAGTGIGKSLAYALPAALWATQRREKVIVSTYTRALQEQLISQDLPLVQDALARRGVPFSFELLMGAENYLCVQRLDRAARAPASLPFAEDSAGGGPAAEALGRLAGWALSAETGRRSLLPLAVPNRLWEAICRDADICLGRRGRFWEACLYRKDLERARAADVVVVNHHLFLSGLPLPAFGAVIFDEAHNLDRAAAGFFGLELSDWKLKRLLEDIHPPSSGRGLISRVPIEPALKQAMGEAAANAFSGGVHFFEDLALAAGLVSGPAADETRTRRLRQPPAVEDRLTEPLLALAGALSQAMGSCETAETEADVRTHRDRCLQAVAAVRNFLACDSPDHVYWVELRLGRRGRHVTLHRDPIDVSEALRESVFEKHPRSILTSATLAVGGSFAPFRSRVGLEGSPERQLHSPFDYSRQALLYTDPDMPDPNQEPALYESMIVERCRELAHFVPGGIFVLFSSWSLLEKVSTRLEAAGIERPLFRQGTREPAGLLKDFREAGDGLLCGTDTFWQGVDVPGSALSCVVITRLPFLAPDSPLEEARQEWMAARGQDAFRDYTLPQAVIRFRQGFGRLIRSHADRGAVVILDPRIHTKRYGSLFLRSVPDCRRVHRLDDVRRFFEEDSAAV